MHFKPFYKKLLKSEEFKKWKKDNPSFTLAHVFHMNDEANKDIWQIGFFDLKSDTITTFIVCDEDIKVIPGADIFKKENSLIKELDISKVGFDFDKALKIAHELHRKEYSKEPIMKEILILQHIDQGQVYNITFLLRSFKALNIKIDASNEKVISHHLDSIVSFEKGKD